MFTEPPRIRSPMPKCATWLACQTRSKGSSIRRRRLPKTPAGQEIARRMREHARSRTVQLNEPQGVREVLGSDAIEALRRSGLRESEAVQQVLAADVIELPRPDAPKVPVPSRPFFGRTE